MYWVYLLQSERNGRYYVGYCEDVERRLEQHNAGKVKATRHIRPWRVAYREEHSTGTEARQREYYLKSLKSRKVLEELINAGH